MGLNDGLDVKAFVARAKDASPSERRMLLSSYCAWIFQGARAQGWRGGVGLALFGISAMFALTMTIYKIGDVWLYLFAAIGACIGAVLARAAFRRERDWRRANPFKYRV